MTYTQRQITFLNTCILSSLFLIHWLHCKINKNGLNKKSTKVIYYFLRAIYRDNTLLRFCSCALDFEKGRRLIYIETGLLVAHFEIFIYDEVMSAALLLYCAFLAHANICIQAFCFFSNVEMWEQSIYLWTSHKFHATEWNSLANCL